MKKNSEEKNDRSGLLIFGILLTVALVLVAIAVIVILY